MITDPTTIWILAASVICGVAGAAMLLSIGRAGKGFLLGLLLGPVGLAIAFRLQRSVARSDREYRRLRADGA